MLDIVAWLSRLARTIPVRSPLSKVTPALSIATSVPDPMAMPTSAAARGRRIVDAVAGHGNHPAFTLEPGDYGALLVRQALGLDLLDPKPPSNRLGGRAVVARQHDAPDALCLERGQRLKCLLLDRVGDRERTPDLTLAANENPGAAHPPNRLRP